MNWISIKESLPLLGQSHRYLFFNGGKEVTFGYAYEWEKESDEHIWINDLNSETNEVATHWMPLPEPPKE